VKKILVGLVLSVALMSLGLTLKSQVCIVGQKVMLSDLTDDVVPSDILIAYAPPPGHSMVLNGRSVAYRIEKLLGVSVAAPETINVLRLDPSQQIQEIPATETFSKVDVQEAIIEAVKKAVMQSRTDVVATEIIVNIDGKVSPPQGVERFELSLARISRSSFSVLVRYLDGRGSNLSVDWLRANAEVKRPIWVAVRRILAGEILANEDAILTTFNVLDLDGYVDSSNSVAGMKVTRSFNRFEPFDPSYLKTPPLVEKGTVIMAVFDTGWMKVSTFVRLMEDGYANRFVVSRNVQTGKLVYGLLSNEAILLVQPFLEVSGR